MRKLLVVVAAALIVVAFVGGYWLGRVKVAEVRQEATTCRLDLMEARAAQGRADAKARLTRLMGQLLALQEAVEGANLGEAQTLSSAFFDAVRDESTKAPDATARTSLGSILTRRDAFTAALARREPSVREILVHILRDLRLAQGHPVASPPPPKEAPAS